MFPMGPFWLKTICVREANPFKIPTFGLEMERMNESGSSIVASILVLCNSLEKFLEHHGPFSFRVCTYSTSIAT